MPINEKYKLASPFKELTKADDSFHFSLKYNPNEDIGSFLVDNTTPTTRVRLRIASGSLGVSWH